MLGVMGRISKDLLHAVVPDEEKPLFTDLSKFPFSSNRIININGAKVGR